MCQGSESYPQWRELAKQMGYENSKNLDMNGIADARLEKRSSARSFLGKQN